MFLGIDRSLIQKYATSTLLILQRNKEIDPIQLIRLIQSFCFYDNMRMQI